MLICFNRALSLNSWKPRTARTQSETVTQRPPLHTSITARGIPATAERTRETSMALNLHPLMLPVSDAFVDGLKQLPHESVRVAQGLRLDLIEGVGRLMPV